MKIPKLAMSIMSNYVKSKLVFIFSFFFLNEFVLSQVVKQKYLSGSNIKVEKSLENAVSLYDKKFLFKEVTFEKPRAASSIGDFSNINHRLVNILPGFEKLLKSASISPYFDKLYDKKIYALKRGEMMPYYMFYDCASILRMVNHQNGQKVILVQSDMDVVTDGSDPVRKKMLNDYNLARTSNWYLPETSYSWRNKSGATNPFLEYYPSVINKLNRYRKEFESEYASDRGVVWRELIKSCDAQIYRMKARGMGSSVKNGLRLRRFLLAEDDPFVVLPRDMVNLKGEWSPKMGDVAVVIYKDMIIPAILGDAGPKHKIGEAALKIAKLINSKSSGNTSATSRPEITYLIFPKSRKSIKTPDLGKIYDNALLYLNKIGGIGSQYVLHRFE